VNWGEFEAAAPELAANVRARFEATGLSIMATVRRDGSPRISPVEAFFDDTDMWLGMMGASRKARDLQRDPRLALHSATADKNVAEGDAKVAGRAIEVTDADGIARFVAVTSAVLGGAPPEPFHCFTVDVTEASFLMPAGDHLDIDIWTAGSAPRRVERR
jgi:putative heme iron utilization protein